MLISPSLNLACCNVTNSDLITFRFTHKLKFMKDGLKFKKVLLDWENGELISWEWFSEVF